MKDNTNLELPLKEWGLKMSLSGKTTTISCQIDLGAIESIRPLYRMVVRFRPNSKVPRAHNSTDPRIKPVHHLFDKMGPPKSSKIQQAKQYFTDLPDAWQKHAFR